MVTIDKLNQQLKEVQNRNKRVEIDKAWETSLTRRLIIVLLTYFVMVLFFFFARLPKPFINAIVPAVAFVISTMTIDAVKRIWIRQKNKHT